MEYRQGFAIVIGAGADLPNTVDDAKAIAGILTNPSCCAYPSRQVKLLTDGKASRAAIVDAFAWLTLAVTEDSTVVIYFSGHGVELPEFYLMPFAYDFRDLENTALSEQWFSQALQKIRSNRLLVMLDCCHAGGQAQLKGFSSSPLPSSVLQEFGRHSGKVVLASSRKDEKSYTGEPYSVFTEAVMEGLSGQGAFEQDGYARVLDIALWVSRKVPEHTNNLQNPILKVKNLEDNFPIAWYAGGEKEPKLFTGHNYPVEAGLPDYRQIESWQRMVKRYRENLLMIEERMSEYVIFTDIPLQLIKSRQDAENRIHELEVKLN